MRTEQKRANQLMKELGKVVDHFIDGCPTPSLVYIFIHDEQYNVGAAVSSTSLYTAAALAKAAQETQAVAEVLFERAKQAAAEEEEERIRCQ